LVLLLVAKRKLSRGGGNGLLLGLGTLTEAVLEATGDVLQVAHTAGTGGLSALSLDGPVDCKDEIKF
jgi:hypothetical protein